MMLGHTDWDDYDPEEFEDEIELDPDFYLNMDDDQFEQFLAELHAWKQQEA